MTIVVSNLLSIMPNLKRHEPVELGAACYLIAALGTTGLNEGFQQPSIAKYICRYG